MSLSSKIRREERKLSEHNIRSRVSRARLAKPRVARAPEGQLLASLLAPRISCSLSFSRSSCRFSSNFSVIFVRLRAALHQSLSCETLLSSDGKEKCIYEPLYIYNTRVLKLFNGAPASCSWTAFKKMNTR